MLRTPDYLWDPETRLGQKHHALMAKELKNKSYAAAKPKNQSDDMWIEMINDTILKVAGAAPAAVGTEGGHGHMRMCATPALRSAAWPAGLGCGVKRTR